MERDSIPPLARPFSLILNSEWDSTDQNRSARWKRRRPRWVSRLTAVIAVNFKRYSAADTDVEAGGNLLLFGHQGADALSIAVVAAGPHLSRMDC